MKKDLGGRMKEFYELRSKFKHPRRTYTIIKIKGISTNKIQNVFSKPFDDWYVRAMGEVGSHLCRSIDGAMFGYVHGDEISILLTDFNNIKTDAWFDGDIQNIVSVATSLATSKFNHLRILNMIENSVKLGSDGLVRVTPYTDDIYNMGLTLFKTKTFTIPSKSEVKNYFINQQLNCVRNSILKVANHHYSHDELKSVSLIDMKKMITVMDDDWDEYENVYKYGCSIYKFLNEHTTSYISKEKKQHTYCRTVWNCVDSPLFTIDKNFLNSRVPDI